MFWVVTSTDAAKVPCFLQVGLKIGQVVKKFYQGLSFLIYTCQDILMHIKVDH